MINNFEDFKFNRQLLNAIADLNYSEPTPIQVKTIPLLLQGHDVLGVAQTGTGKTAAYLLPILMRIKYAQGQHLRALILAPTRELVMQIEENLRLLGKYTDLRYVALYGGLGPKTQIETLAKGVDIIVATPGRFMDLYLKNLIVVKHLTTLVLDEADKMMDMGFMPQINRILEIIPRKRQNALFSATFPPKVELLSQNFLEGPIRIEITPQATTADTVAQYVYDVPNFRTKINLLEHLLTDPIYHRVMVFVRSKEVADNIYKFLKRKVLTDDDIRVIHSNKGQNTRINSMDAFKQGDIRVLVATDVAARGIDVIEVSHVINFDVPIIYEDYVHRIGRTGRANLTGNALTFRTIADEYHFEKIEKIIHKEIDVLAIPAGVDIPETPFEEQQDMLREIDDQRRKEDPDFKGAFHEKKIKKVVASKTKKVVDSKSKSGAKNSKPSYKPKSKDFKQKKRF
jgi:ATP-dependent RNA helicase RhlE